MKKIIISFFFILFFSIVMAQVNKSKLIGKWIQDDEQTTAIVTAKTVTYSYRGVSSRPLKYQIQGGRWYEESGNSKGWPVSLDRFDKDKLIIEKGSGMTEIWHRVKP